MKRWLRYALGYGRPMETHSKKILLSAILLVLASKGNIPYHDEAKDGNMDYETSNAKLCSSAAKRNGRILSDSFRKKCVHFEQKVYSEAISLNRFDNAFRMNTVLQDLSGETDYVHLSHHEKAVIQLHQKSKYGKKHPSTPQKLSNLNVKPIHKDFNAEEGLFQGSTLISESCTLKLNLRSQTTDRNRSLTPICDSSLENKSTTVTRNNVQRTYLSLQPTHAVRLGAPTSSDPFHCCLLTTLPLDDDSQDDPESTEDTPIVRSESTATVNENFLTPSLDSSRILPPEASFAASDTVQGTPDSISSKSVSDRSSAVSNTGHGIHLSGSMKPLSSISSTAATPVARDSDDSENSHSETASFEESDHREEEGGNEISQLVGSSSRYTYSSLTRERLYDSFSEFAATQHWSASRSNSDVGDLFSPLPQTANDDAEYYDSESYEDIGMEGSPSAGNDDVSGFDSHTGHSVPSSAESVTPPSASSTPLYTLSMTTATLDA